MTKVFRLTSLLKIKSFIKFITLQSNLQRVRTRVKSNLVLERGIGIRTSFRVSENVH